jgi:hypothetical protein
MTDLPMPWPYDGALPPVDPRAARVHRDLVPPLSVSLLCGAVLPRQTVALLAGAVSRARMDRRRLWAPGTGVADEAEPPVVTEILRAWAASAPAPPGDADGGGDPEAVALRRVLETVPAADSGRLPRIPFLVSGGDDVVLDLALPRAVTLAGPGGADAVRAVAVNAVAERHRPGGRTVDLMTTRADAAGLLGLDPGADRPPWLCVVPGDAEDLCVAVRGELGARRNAVAASHRPLLVVGTVPAGPAARLARDLAQCRAHVAVGAVLCTERTGRVGGSAWEVGGAARPGDAGAFLFTCPRSTASSLLGLLAIAPAAELRPLPALAPGEWPPPAPPAPGPSADSDPWVPTTLDARLSPGSSATARLGRLGDRQQAAPFALTVLGTVRLSYEVDGVQRPVCGLDPACRALLAYLALHPRGVTVDEIDGVLSPDGVDERGARAAYATQRIRTAMLAATEDPRLHIISVDGGTWTLRGDLVRVDASELCAAVARVHAAGGRGAALFALERVDEVYCGHLAQELGRTWAHTHRERLRRAVLGAFAEALSHIGPDDWQPRWPLLVRMLEREPYSEWVFRQMARAHTYVRSPHTQVETTYDLLTTTLATVGADPGPTTAGVFDFLLGWPVNGEDVPAG